MLTFFPLLWMFAHAFQVEGADVMLCLYSMDDKDSDAKLVGTGMILDWHP